MCWKLPKLKKADILCAFNQFTAVVTVTLRVIRAGLKHRRSQIENYIPLVLFGIDIKFILVQKML
jgi:hypothetical protein